MTTFSDRLGNCCVGVFLTFMLVGAAVQTIRQYYPGFLNPGAVPTAPTPSRLGAEPQTSSSQQVSLPVR